ncbi:hypothetical protein CTAM01_14389, partial [Colletotrichum tamarilloi]
HAKRLRPIYADTDSSLRTTRRRGGKYNSTRVSARYRKHARTLIAATCSGDRGWEEGRESRPGWCGRGEGGVRGGLRRMVGGRDRLLERDWREVTWLKVDSEFRGYIRGTKSS